MGSVLIGLRRSNQLFKYLLMLRRQLMFLPHSWESSAPLVEILSLRIRFLLVAVTSHRKLWWMRLQWECSLTLVPAKLHVKVLLYGQYQSPYPPKIFHYQWRYNCRKWSAFPCHFYIPVKWSIQDHVFEIFTMVADIHEGIDLVFGPWKMTEIEGEIQYKNRFFQVL